VAGGFAVQLAEVFQLAHRQVVAGQVQQARKSASSRGRWTARSGRGRPNAGWPGCGCRCSPHKATAMSAMPMGAPGCPELAC
jgi:hypothetical protein